MLSSARRSADRLYIPQYLKQHWMLLFRHLGCLLHVRVKYVFLRSFPAEPWKDRREEEMTPCFSLPWVAALSCCSFSAIFSRASLLLQRNQSEIAVQGSLPPGQAQALDPRGRTGHDHLWFPCGLALGDPISAHRFLGLSFCQTVIAVPATAAR